MWMANWSELTYDVLEHLTRFLPIRDYHRFSAVCQNWGRVAKEKRHFPAQQIPWLALGEEKDTKRRKFFNLSDDKHYNLNVPELHGNYICGSKYGWLFTLDLKLNFQLLNPMTRQCYNLPSPPPFYSDNFDELYPAPNLAESDERDEVMQRISVIKATLDYDPNKRSDFTVLILYGEVHTPSFWRPGNDSWTNINGLPNYLDDIAFYKGKFYTVSNPVAEKHSIIYEIDVGIDPKATKVGPRVPLHGDPNFEFADVDEIDYGAVSYIVEVDGELVLVERYFERSDDEHRITTEFVVHKVDLEAESYRTCQHIDGCTIFLGATSSPVAVSPCQFANCMKDAIYFTDLEHGQSELYGLKDLGICDLAGESITQSYFRADVFHPLIAPPTWFTPNPW